MIREFKENDLNIIMRLWLETNTAAHDFVDGDTGKTTMIKSNK